MFYALSIGSMLGYTIQTLLLVHHARKIDGLSLAFYRNISFVITLLPLCTGSSRTDFAFALDHWYYFAIAGLAGGIYLALSYTSYRAIPVGIHTTITKASSTITITALGWWYFGERITLHAGFIIAIILFGSLLLGMQRSSFAHLNNRHLYGFSLCVLSAIPLALTTLAFAAMTRQDIPLLSGYLWEISIACASAVLMVFRYLFLRIPLQKISWRMFLRIALCSSPTLLGTGFFSIALSMGPVAIVNAIGSSSIAH